MKNVIKFKIPLIGKKFSDLVKGREVSEIKVKLQKNSQMYHKELEDKKQEILNQTNDKIFNKIFNIPKENNMNESSNIHIFESKDSIIQGGKNFTLNKENIINSGNNQLINDLLHNNKLDFNDSRIQIQTLNMNDNTILNDELKNEYKIYEVKLGEVTSIPKNEFTKNLKLTEEISKENEYMYEMSLLGRKLDVNEEYKILNNFLTVDNKENHFVSTAIFQEENTKKFEENETPLSILIKNPLLIIGFVITGYILYPKLWKKEYFSKLSLERNNDYIYHSYLNNGESLYNYMNYRRGLYACVRSNFS